MASTPATPLHVATPALFVVAEHRNVPPAVIVIVWPGTGAPVSVRVRVADRLSRVSRSGFRPSTAGAAFSVVAVCCTTSLTGADVLPAKLGSPWYAAFRVCVPLLSVVVERLAWPPLSGAVPSCVAPSKNATVPVGVPAPGATTATAAVSVTAWPGVAGDGLAVRDDVVAALFTCWASAGDVELAYTPEPAYTAVSEWPPTASPGTVSVATSGLPPFSVALPICVLPSENATVPAGWPAPEPLTVAVSVTGCPKTGGFADEASAVVVPAIANTTSTQ